MQEDNKVRNVELAYLGLCLKGVQPNELNLTQEVLSIGRMTSDTSLAMTVQDSIRLLVVVKGIELEESSQRYVITFQAMSEDHDETIRSERLDDRHRKIVRHLWSQDLVGHKVLLFKKNEESNDPKNSKGYRVAPWMIDLGPAR